MGSSARIAVSAALAIPVAIALFFIMHSLVSRDFQQEDIKARKIADIVVPDKTIETNLKEVKPEKVEDPEEPPPDLEPIQFGAYDGHQPESERFWHVVRGWRVFAHCQSGAYLPTQGTDTRHFRVLHCGVHGD
jgi:hypothetical protein